MLDSDFENKSISIITNTYRLGFFVFVFVFVFALELHRTDDFP